MAKMRHSFTLMILTCTLLMGMASSALGQSVTADIVQADRLRSNDTGANGQFWERTEDSQNTMRYLYGPLSGTPGKVDINNILFQRLRITGRGSLISVGRTDLGPDVALPTGAGGRLMWSIVKRAFRVGEVSANQWDDINVGQYSLATGFNTQASGANSVALGDNTKASGFSATAMGNFSSATGDVSTTMGTGTVASNFAATAIGNFATASGQVSTAIGNGATANGDFSIAMGNTTTASGRLPLAIGNLVTSNASNAMILGSSDPTQTVRMTNNIPNSLMIGFNSTIPTLIVGSSAGAGTTGQVMIGNPGLTSSAFKLFVNGTVGATAFQVVSDAKLKANIRSIDNALEKILNLEGVKFDWKQDTDTGLVLPSEVQIGFVAQEVEKVLPELVSTSDNGYKAVSYQNISAVLVEAVKQQQKIIEQQKTALAGQTIALTEQKVELEQVKAQLQTIMEKLANGNNGNK